MRDDREPLERLLGGLLPPEPPPGLHGPVLRAASAALARDVRADAWTRIWESRPLRLAWGSATLLLLVGNVVVAVIPRASAIQPRGPRATVEASPGDELGAIARLPRIDLGTRPALGSAAPPAVPPKPARPHGEARESAT